MMCAKVKFHKEKEQNYKKKVLLYRHCGYSPNSEISSRKERKNQRGFKIKSCGISNFFRSFLPSLNLTAFVGEELHKSSDSFP